MDIVMEMEIAQVLPLSAMSAFFGDRMGATISRCIKCCSDFGIVKIQIGITALLFVTTNFLWNAWRYLKIGVSELYSLTTSR